MAINLEIIKYWEYFKHYHFNNYNETFLEYYIVNKNNKC